MIRNKIYSIVEGHGEASSSNPTGRAAVNILVNKILSESDDTLSSLHIHEKKPPFRLNGSDFRNGDRLERAIKLHAGYPDCAILLILFDMDDGCPVSLAYSTTEKIKALGAFPFSIIVVAAKKEYECWFLASLESIHDGHKYDGDPEEKRDAKGYLRKNYNYKPTAHQAEYTQLINIEMARARSRSFRRLVHAFEEATDAHKADVTIISPMRP